MPIQSRSSAYGLALLFVALGFMARVVLSPIIGDEAPFMFFILAAIFSSLFGGIGPGLLAMVAGQFVAHYYFITPKYTFYPSDAATIVYWCMYNCVTLLCIGVVAMQHRASAKSEESMQRAHRHEEQLRTIIREMTAAEERVRELASVVESADDGIMSLALDGLVKSWNVGAERLFGFNATDMAGKPLSRVVPEEKQEEHRQLLARAAAGESTAPVETTRLTKDGKLLHISLRCSPLRDQDGKVLGISAIARDNTRAKKAEAEIQRLNHDLKHHLFETRQVMEALPVGLAITSHPSSGLLELNPLLAKMLGVNTCQVRLDEPQTFSIRHDGRDVPLAELPARLACAENRRLRDWEATLVRADSSALEVLIHAAALHDEEGRSRGIIGAFVDVTELKRAHAELAETEQRFRTMADTAPLLIWMTDAEQQHTWVNKTWRTFTGRLNELESPEGWAEPVHPEDRDAWKKAIESAIEREESFEIEYRLRQADGEWRWLLDRGVPRFGHGGEFLGFIGSCMDVTEWKQAEEALENKFDELRAAQHALRAQNEELARHRRELELERGRYLELFDSAPIGYIITSRQGVIQQVNRAAADMAGESARFLEGFPLARLLAKQDRVAFFATIGKLTRDGVTCVQDWEVTVTPHSRPAFACSIAVNLMHDAHGKVAGLRWILRDITDRKEVEQRVMRLNAELEQRVKERTAALEAANRELEAFSYSVSHDLRAPLRSINGFSKAVLEEYEDKLDEQGVKYLRYAHDASVRMGHLIEDLLALSRVSRGELSCDRIDLSGMVRSVSADLASRYPQRNVQLLVQPGLWGCADTGLMRVAIENLMANAWKFTSGREQARIEVGFTTKDENPCMFIRDNGAGFDMAAAHRLFGVFQRLHSQEAFPGTGIGLATVRRIMHRHGGEVWAEGRPDQGATFYFTLPEIGCDQEEASSSQCHAAPVITADPEPLLTHRIKPSNPKRVKLDRSEKPAAQA